MFRLLAVMLTCASSALSALTIDHEITDHRPIFPLTLQLTMTGEIVQGDALRLIELLQSLDQHDFREIHVRIDSPGGSLSEGLLLGRLLAARSEILTTRVGSTADEVGECASACVLVYLGGDLRYLGDNASLGVHQFYDGSGEMSADDAIDMAQVLSSEIVTFLNQQRVDLAFFERMTETVRGIDWVPHNLLNEWRVVTGHVFDEHMEYTNVNGKVGLHMVHESIYGTNQMNMYCDRGMVAYAVLDEPQIAMIGEAAIILDGNVTPVGDFELMNRDNGRTRFFMRLPRNVVASMTTAKTIGARIIEPSGGMFWGFEQNIRDERVREIAESCLPEYGSTPPVNSSAMIEMRNTDLVGGDLTSGGVRDISFAQCKQICMNVSECRAVSYIQSKSWCWPKGYTQGRNSASGIISAAKR